MDEQNKTVQVHYSGQQNIRVDIRRSQLLFRLYISDSKPSVIFYKQTKPHITVQYSGIPEFRPFGQKGKFSAFGLRFRPPKLKAEYGRNSREALENIANVNYQW